MATVTAQKVPKRTESPEDTLARFCFYFPQYTYAQARQMPFIRIRQMLRVVLTEQARQMFFLTQIAASPHIEKGRGVKKMLNYFKELMDTK